MSGGGGGGTAGGVVCGLVCGLLCGLEGSGEDWFASCVLRLVPLSVSCFTFISRPADLAGDGGLGVVGVFGGEEFLDK